MNYWHMQIPPDDKAFAEENIYYILEHEKFIGLGDWEKGLPVIENLKKK